MQPRNEYRNLTKKIKLNSALFLEKKALQIASEYKLQFEISVFDSDNKNLHKQTLVFLHGNSTCKEVFSKQINYFRKTNRIIAIDLPGHGESTKISNLDNLTENEKNILATQVYSLLGLIRQVQETLKQLNVNKAHFIGWSLGGHIAYGMAVIQPNIVLSLITNGTPPINFSFAGLRKGCSPWFVDCLVKDWIDNPKLIDEQLAINIVQDMGFNDPMNTDKYIVTAMMDTDPLLRKYLFANLKQDEDPLEYNAEKFIKMNNEIPILFLEGENDKGININYIKDIFEIFISSKSIPKQLILFPSSGHAVFKSKPEKFNESIDNFLKKCYIAKLRLSSNNFLTHTKTTKENSSACSRIKNMCSIQ